MLVIGKLSIKIPECVTQPSLDRGGEQNKLLKRRVPRSLQDKHGRNGVNPH